MSKNKFSLTHLLIVVFIVFLFLTLSSHLLLSSLVTTVDYFANTKIRIQENCKIINILFETTKTLPNGLDEIPHEYLEKYLRFKRFDCWENKLIYNKIDDNRYTMKSLGADKKLSVDDIEFAVNAQLGTIKINKKK
ncbi:hypothetical protein [Candidatus Uabimicrobium sp. HlEnr_7]|uniref:hypothetical protein n=1 Tax=Candidatus Uabimicrobium helgolandensis TaxID=3095367 RepID=UPI00355728BC